MSENTRYYIKDLSGNYYNIQENGQLCVAMPEEEVQTFEYNDAASHVGTGKKSSFYKIVPAEDNREDVFGEFQVEDSDITAEMPPDRKYDSMRRDWQKYLQDYCSINERMKGYKKELNSELSKCDQEICDIVHLIEFNEISESDCVCLVDMLKDARVRRRAAKDELRKMELVQDVMEHGDPLNRVKSNLKQMKELNFRQYAPRQLPEIFEGYQKAAPIVKVLFENKEPELQQEREVDSDKGGVINMIRRETVYDGKENDWVGFIRNQMTFFANVEQYITNLELDIRRLDDEIEEILLLAEDTHCNAAQGYQVYKMLRERRKERKQKMTEKQMLEVIATNIDCKWMTDTCQYCEEQIIEIQEQAIGTTVVSELVEQTEERLRIVG